MQRPTNNVPFAAANEQEAFDAHRADWIRDHAYSLIQSGRVAANEAEHAVEIASAIFDTVVPTNSGAKAKRK